MTEGQFLRIEDLEEGREKTGLRYTEFLRIPAMSAGLYVLGAGDVDGQSAHSQDELYYVLSGKARMRVGKQDQEVTPGSVIFVPAKLDHRFYKIEEQLSVLVFFAPAEN